MIYTFLVTAVVVVLCFEAAVKGHKSDEETGRPSHLGCRIS